MEKTTEGLGGEKKGKPTQKRPFEDIGKASRDASELQVVKGGAGKQTANCWEVGAKSGEAYMFFSCKNEKGGDLGEREYRCVLCAHFYGREEIKKAASGQTNLWKHLESVHGIAKHKGKVQTGAVIKKGQPTLDAMTRISDADAQKAAVKYVIKKAQPFSLVEDASFKEYSQTISKRPDLSLQTRNTVKKAISDMSKVLHQRMTEFIQAAVVPVTAGGAPPEERPWVRVKQLTVTANGSRRRSSAEVCSIFWELIITNLWEYTPTWM